jgi:hypothetical protein
MLRRRLFSDEEASSLSVLAFGTSDTWGSGIVGESTNPAQFAYPALMGSGGATNLGIRASGPGYPAVCLQTMVGESSHQVIILEYMLRADEGLQQLAHRVRRRFPHAILIFLDIWYPRMVKIVGSGFRTDKDSIGLESYQKHLGFKSLNDPDFVKYLAQNPNKMFLNHRYDLQAIQKDVVHGVHGYIWQMPMPTQDDHLGAHVAQLAYLFSDDYKHLSKKGHKFVARGVKRLLHSIPANKLSTATATWDHNDSCSNWFLTGIVLHEHGERVKLHMFDETANKFALEVDPSGGSLIVKNPFSEPATLYLSYMASGPPKKYPKTLVTIGQESTLIDPIAEGSVHVAITSKVGVLQPGDNPIHLQAVEGGEWPLRLVATSITQVELMQDLGVVNIEAIAEQHPGIQSNIL